MWFSNASGSPTEELADDDSRVTFGLTWNGLGQKAEKTGSTKKGDTSCGKDEANFQRVWFHKAWVLSTERSVSDRKQSYKESEKNPLAKKVLSVLKWWKKRYRPSQIKESLCFQGPELSFTLWSIEVHRDTKLLPTLSLGYDSCRQSPSANRRVITEAIECKHPYLWNMSRN